VNIERYTCSVRVTINGSAAAGYSSGQATLATEALAANLPDGYAYDWTGTTYQEKISGGQGWGDLRHGYRIRLPGAGGAVRKLGGAICGTAGHPVRRARALISASRCVACRATSTPISAW